MILMEYKCNHCSGLTTVSKCCNKELTITKSGRTRCSSCNKFCKITECNKCPIIADKFYDNNEQGENKDYIPIALVLFMIMAIIAAYFFTQ